MTTDELLQRWDAGSMTGDELRELTSRLEDPAGRCALLEAWLLESGLPERLPGAALSSLQPVERPEPFEDPATGWEKRRTGWFSWRPLVAAAAGVVLGMFCTSVGFAYLGPALGKMQTLLSDSFENGPLPEGKGVPRECGIWSGDFTEIVGEQQGVKPESGTKMLRFVRADYEGKAKTEGNHISDVYRLVDVRPYRREFADGSVVAQLSAAFNAFAFPAQEHHNAALTLYAIDSQTAASLANRDDFTLWTKALAFAAHHRTRLDRDPKTWQPVSTDLRLPAETDFLFLHIAVLNSSASQTHLNFDGHYLDSVRLTLGRRTLKP